MFNVLVVTELAYIVRNESHLYIAKKHGLYPIDPSPFNNCLPKLGYTVGKWEPPFRAVFILNCPLAVVDFFPLKY